MRLNLLNLTGFYVSNFFLVSNSSFFFGFSGKLHNAVNSFMYSSLFLKRRANKTCKQPSTALCDSINEDIFFKKQGTKKRKKNDFGHISLFTHPSKAFSLTRALSVELSFLWVPCFFLMTSAASAPIANSMSSGSTSSNQRSSLQWQREQSSHSQPKPQFSLLLLTL